MKLFCTSEEFDMKGIPGSGIPFICDRDMELVDAPNEYLRYIAMVRGRTRSPETWLTYGKHLHEYYSFLEANGLIWNSVNQTHIAAWRNAMLERGCTRSTVNQRLRCVHAFYAWANRSNKIDTLPYEREDVFVSKPRGFLAHVDASGNRVNASELTIQTAKQYPRFLLMGQAVQFLEALTPDSLKIMGYLALLTGMRRNEITRLDYRVVPSPTGYPSNKQLKMVLDPIMTTTKGNKERTVMVPYDLAVRMWDFFTFEWPKRNELHKKKHGRKSNRFFLSIYGDELDQFYMNNQFRRTSKKTGIKCNPHLLRHTFGTYELLRMSKKGDKNKALLWVRDRMGHSSITTTEKYIHAADLVANDVVDDYQAAVCKVLKYGNQTE